MSAQGNVHDGNVTEAQAAFLKAFTPLIIEMSRKGPGEIHHRQSEPAGQPPSLVCADVRDSCDAGAEPCLRQADHVRGQFPWMSTVSRGDSASRKCFARLVNLPDDASLGKIEELLKRRKHLISDVLFEQILAEQAKFFLKQEGGVDFGLPRGGLASFVPVENPDGSVSIMFVIWRQEDKWYRTEYSLEYENSWRRNNCLVVAKSGPFESLTLLFLWTTASEHPVPYPRSCG